MKLSKQNEKKKKTLHTALHTSYFVEGHVDTLTNREGHTRRILARGLESTNQVQRGLYRKVQGPIFSQHDRKGSYR